MQICKSGAVKKAYLQTKLADVAGQKIPCMHLQPVIPPLLFGSHRARERRDRDAWERALRAARPGAIEQGGRPVAFAFNILWPTELLHGVIAHARTLAQGWRIKNNRLIQRSALVVCGAAATAVAIAATIATQAYIDHPAEVWTRILAERTHSPLYDTDGRLAGSLGPASGPLPSDDQRNFAFIPLQGTLPPTYAAALLELEDKHFGKSAWFNLCGVDVLSMAGRWLASGATAGGSGITQQLAKQLKAPEWGNERSLAQKMTRKFKELGASCQLWNKLTSDGGSNNVLQHYSSIAPMWQGNGSLRGLEATAPVVFGVAPQALSDAQQLVLAASVKEPLRLLAHGDTAIDCSAVYPRVNNPAFRPDVASSSPARANQCRVLHRALSSAPQVLSGQQLDAARSGLRDMQRAGIVPANEFKSVASKRLINLTSRTAATLPSALLSMVTRELDELDGFAYGDPIHLTVDALAQRQFAEQMTTALKLVQASPAGRGVLCIPLVRMTSPKYFFSPRCGVVQPDQTAEVFAMKFDAASGAVQRIYASSPQVLDTRISVGSVAKLVVLATAVGAGYEPDSQWCPRQVSDGTRQLRRVGNLERGFTDEQCARGQRVWMTLEQATARSDNLVFAELAKHLGDKRLAAALAAFGLTANAGEQLWYSLAFGTLGATPRELAYATQAVFAAAYGIQTHSTAPKVLADALEGQAPAARNPLNALIHTSAQRTALRTLLRAPVAAERATLGFVRDAVDAGKSGSTQSASRDTGGHRNAHAKLAVTYQADQGAVNIFIVSAPNPQVPLALHSVQGSLFAAAHRVLLKAP